ncbi:MAG: GtrA family protein [Defluviitaleaceae bacterium]|nr:GtrA family protein [Defluviitaleaceae bacterium]
MKKFFAKKNFVAQFLKFAAVGVSNTAVYLLIYNAFLFFGAHYLIASAVAFIFSVLNAYFWSAKFVFNAKKEKKQIIKIYLSYGFTFLLSLIAMFVMVDVLGISQYAAPFFNLFLTVPLNFLLNKFWVFG